MIDPGPLDNRNKAMPAGVGVDSIANSTVLELTVSLLPPTSHSASAVLVISRGAVCADASVQAAERSVPAASTKAACLMNLVNTFIANLGGGRLSRAPPNIP